MRKFLKVIFCFLLVSTLIISVSCQKLSREPCTIHGNVVIWGYNEYVGIKADVGAKVILMRRSNEPLKFDPALVHTSTDKTKGVYVTQVNMVGEYEFTDIPSGTYDLLILSKSTNRRGLVELNPCDSVDELMRKADQLMPKVDEHWILGKPKIRDSLEVKKFAVFKENILIPHFSERDYENVTVVLLGRNNKYEVKGQIKLVPGDVKEINVDFGNTYW